MKAQPNREKDKKLLLQLTENLDISKDRLKVDECGDWNIIGRKGKIFTDSKFWYVFVEETGKIRWNNIKIKLKFMELTQDSDDEGILRLERMPSYKEGEELRNILGLRRRPVLSEERRAVLVSTRFNSIK